MEIWMRKRKVSTEASKEYTQWLGGSNWRESLADRLRGKRGKRRRKCPETTAHKLDQKTGNDSIEVVERLLKYMKARLCYKSF
jgi:hypothetical protein